jgi:hypothetical protein
MEVGESEIKTVASYTFQMAVGTYTLAIQKPTALAMPGGIQGLGGAKYELPAVPSLDNTQPQEVQLFLDWLAKIANSLPHQYCQWLGPNVLAHLPQELSVRGCTKHWRNNIVF